MQEANRFWSCPDFRQQYVKSELNANGFQADPANLVDQVAEEAAYALWPPVHENLQPSYGAIVTDQWELYFSRIDRPYGGHFQRCNSKELGRTLADGVTSFYVRDGHGEYLWTPEVLAFGDESALFSLRDSVLFKNAKEKPHDPPKGSDFIIIQRSKDGSVTIMHWDGVIVAKNGFWYSKKYQYSLRVEEQIEDLDGDLSAGIKDTLRSVLSICLHQLSPRGCGATIVIMRGDEGLKKAANFANAIRVTLGLTVREKSHHEMITHALSQVDGATLISEQGLVRALGVWLTPTKKDLRGIKSIGGTRQLTAAATSRTTHCPIITVSCDGPVRVYYRGNIIANTEGENRGRPWIAL